MEWIEAKVFTTNECIEPVCAVLLESGVGNVQIIDDLDMKNFLETNNESWDYVDEELMNKENCETTIVFYVSKNEFGNETLLLVKNNMERLKEMDLQLALGRLKIELTNVDDEDWIHEWKKYYHPFPVGEKIIIKPVWEEYDNIHDKIVFNIDPGHAFGTGLHQTTQLCIEQLEKCIDNDHAMTVLDLGCGSGILSVISLMLGASAATAVDIDPNVVKIAYENAAINFVKQESYRVLAGNILTDSGLYETVSAVKYDIIVSNIVADVIISFLPVVKACLKEHGVFISSGIISQRLQDVEAALLENGFIVKGIFTKDDWICVVC